MLFSASATFFRTFSWKLAPDRWPIYLQSLLKWKPVEVLDRVALDLFCPIVNTSLSNSAPEVLLECLVLGDHLVRHCTIETPAHLGYPYFTLTKVRFTSAFHRNNSCFILFSALQTPSHLFTSHLSTRGAQWGFTAQEVGKSALGLGHQSLWAAYKILLPLTKRMLGGKKPLKQARPLIAKRHFFQWPKNIHLGS